MQEIWKDITDYKGLYQVSNLGRIKSLEKIVNANFKFGSTHIYKEKILKPFKDGRGYLKVKLYKNNKGKTISIHKIVVQEFIGKRKLTVNHKDKNKNNNKLENLEYMSNKDNIRYSSAKRIKGKNIVTGEEIIFEAESDVKTKGFNQGNVSKCCLGKRKTHKGYTWEIL